MKDKNLQTIPVMFEKISDIDERFMNVKIYLMHVGLNLNNSYFEKSVVEKAIPTLSNTPILGYIRITEDNEKDFEGHKHILVVENGEFRLKYAGCAYGVIPESCNPRWEIKLCDDGIEREFLVCDGIVWKKFDDAIDIFNRDSIKQQSMELADDFDGYMHEDGYFVFTRFSFFGACILGDDRQPAMINASIEKIFSFDDIKREIQKEMELLKISMGKEFLKKEDWGSGSEIKIDLSKEAADFNTPWGLVDKTVLRNKLLKAKNYKTLVKKCYLMVKDGWEDAPSQKLKYPVCMVKKNTLVLSAKGCQSALSFLERNKDDPDYESAKRKLKKYYKTLELDTSNFEEGGMFQVKDEDKIVFVFELSHDDIRAELYEILNPINEETEEREYNYFVLEVFDDYCIVEDAKDWGNYYKIFYFVDEDDKITLGDKQKIIPMWLTPEEVKQIEEMRNNYEKVKSEFSRLQSSYETVKQERDELLEFKKNIEQEQRRIAEEELFTKFAEKLDEAEINSIKETAGDFTLEELEEKLYSLVGKKMIKFSNDSKKKTKINIQFEKGDNKKIEKPYADIIRKYSKVKNK